MVRLAVLGVLVLLTCWEWMRGTNKHIYRVILLLLCAFFALRYGQGTDYLKYLSIFSEVPPLQRLPSYFDFSFNKVEIGFFYLNSLFRMLRMPFTVFVAFVTVFSFGLLDRFIRRFSTRPMFSVTIFYAVYSLAYMESALRQMLAIALVLGWVLVDWSRDRKWRAMLGVLIATTMHTSAALLLVLPIFFRNEASVWPFDWPKKKLLIWGGLLLAVSAVLNFVNLEPVINLIPIKQLAGTITYYYVRNRDFSVLALANRLVFLVIIGLLAWRKRDELDAKQALLLKLYALGFCVYLLCMSVDEIASRTNVYFRVVEVALLPTLLYMNRDLGKRAGALALAVLGLISFIYAKDMRALMGYSEYYSHNPLKYPYITIFQPDTIISERYVEIKFEPYMNQEHYDQFDFDEFYRRVLRKPALQSPVVPY